MQILSFFIFIVIIVGTGTMTLGHTVSLLDNRTAKAQMPGALQNALQKNGPTAESVVQARMVESPGGSMSFDCQRV